MKHCKAFFILFFVIAASWSSLKSQTITNPRTPAEFEEVRGVVLRWDEKEYYKIFLNVQTQGWTTYWRDRYFQTMNTQATIIREGLNEGLDVYVVDDTSRTGKYGPWLYSAYRVADTLALLGIPPSSRLHIIPYPALIDDLEKVWIRDWGPYNIYRNGVESISIVGRNLDSTIGKYLAKPFIATSVMDGGNFLTDGHGRLVCDASQTGIDRTLFGISDLITVASYKIHIDYYMKLINEETFLVAEIPASNHGPSDSFLGDSVVLESAIAVMKGKTSCFGRPYKFVRVRNTPTYNQNGLTYITSDAGYVNSLILNRTVLVPTYDNPATDTVALNTYRRIMPGYRIVGVSSKFYAARQGEVHCITKELAADNPIFIAHAWLPETTQNNVSQYLIKAYIKTPPGVSHAEVNWSTNPQGGFQSIAMTPTVNDTFVANIPGQSSESVLSYFISATAVGGKQSVKPVVAPTGYYSTFLSGAGPSCTINCPSNINVSNSPGQCGAVVNYPAPTTSGSCGTVTSTPASGTLFPVGITTVTCQTASGPSCSFTVTVVDTQKPTISCATNMIVLENPPGSGGAVVNYASATFSDNCPGAIVTSTPASGSTFLVGTTSVKYKVVDASGNKDSCSFNVTVNGAFPCSITCPNDTTLNNTAGQCGAVVNFPTPTTSGSCGTVTSTPPSGTMFPIGTTTVTCATGAGPSCTFKVTVLDNQKPTIACPSNMTVSESSQGSGIAIVNYPAATVSDNCPGVTVTSTPPSGSTFLFGTTTVKCVAKDASGNSDSCTFTVTVTGCQISSVLRDDFNRANSVLAGTSKWVQLLNHPGTGSINVVTNAMQATGSDNTSNGVAWDTLMSGGSETSLKVTQKSGNFINSSLFIYARMNTKDYNTGTGYRLRYWEQAGADLIEIHRVGTGYGNYTVLVSATREINVGDVITFRVLCDNRTMVGLVNGVQVVTTTDATYIPAQWYFAFREYAFPTPVRFDDFTVTSQLSGPVFSAAPSSIDFGNVNVGGSKLDSVTISNPGTSTLTISSVSSNNARFTVAPTSGSINPSASQKFYITFAPTVTGAQSGSVSFTHNASGSPGSVSVTGTGVAPVFSVAPPGIAFGTILVGTTKQDSVVISNTGTAPLVISSDSSDNSLFTVSPSGATIAAGANKKFYILFSPTGSGPASGNIIFNHNAAGSPGIVTVNGAGGTPSFAVLPLNLSYGDVIVGSSKLDSVVVSNSGTVALTISSVLSDSAQFSVTPSTGSVPASGSQKFYIRFTPTSTGAKSGHIVFTHNGVGSPGTVAVDGNGILSAFAVAPSSLAFGNVLVGSPKQDSLTVSNNGSGTLTITSVSTDNAQFGVTPTSGTVAPSSSMKFYVTFTPTSSGNKSGNVIFNHSAPGSPQSVPVAGAGVAPVFSVLPASIAFGNVGVGANKQDSVTVTNTGTASLVISLVSADSAQYTVSPSSSTIAPAANQKFYVTFTPGSTGLVSGHVNFVHNAAGSPGSVAVSGTGVTPGFSVAPGSLAFGNVNVGANKKDSVTVTNTGTSSLTISSVTSDNARFTVTPTSGALAPSASLKFYVTFAPTANGLQSGTISFAHNAAGSPGSVLVNGSGVQSTIPVITSFVPPSGPTGTVLTINGANFNATPLSNIVYFGAVKANVTAASTTALTVTVPKGATYFPITVLVNGLVAYSLTPFIVTFPSSNVIDATSFAARVDFAAGNQPFGVSIGDVDLDGKPDIQAANSTTVSVMRNTSTVGSITTGSFAAQVVFTAGTDAYIPLLGDLDGDGKLDMLVTNNTNSSISIFRNISTTGSITTGSFAAKLDLVTGSGPQGLYIRDVDGDGRPDLVVGNSGSNTVSIWRNIGTPGSITTGSFAARVDFATAVVPRMIEMGDVDGDGKPDIITPNLTGNNVSVLRNTSTPGSITASSFAAHVDFPVGNGPKSSALGDLDGDGKPDLAVAHYNTNTICLLRNLSTPGTISFAAHVDYVTGNAARSVVLTDVDGDAKLDLEVVNQTSGTLSILKNKSTVGTLTTTSFATPVNFTTGLKPIFLSVGDLDGDGKPDVVVNNADNNTVSIFRNTMALPPAKSLFTGTVETSLPDAFSLAQNYPNPFNPVTDIQYTLPENARVGLRLYNALGQIVQTLVDDVEPAGFKNVQFDAAGLPSGTYFYRLDAVSTENALHTFSTVKKMIVLK